MLYAIAKGMYQNVVALHPTTGMLDKDADATQGGIDSLLIITQWRVGVLLTFARLLGWDVNPIPPIVRSNTKIASIDPNIHLCKPVQLRRKLLFQQAVIVIVTTKGTTKKNDKLVRERHDRVFQRMLFFYRCNAPAVWHHLVTDDRPVRWHQ